MNAQPARLAACCGLLLATLLSACATAQPPSTAAPAATEQPKKRQYVTGSRLPASESTQIVRSIEGGSAHESMRSQPNPGRPGQ